MLEDPNTILQNLSERGISVRATKTVMETFKYAINGYDCMEKLKTLSR